MKYDDASVVRGLRAEGHGYPGSKGTAGRIYGVKAARGAIGVVACPSEARTVIWS